MEKIRAERAGDCLFILILYFVSITNKQNKRQMKTMYMYCASPDNYKVKKHQCYSWHFK